MLQSAAVPSLIDKLLLIQANATPNQKLIVTAFIDAVYSALLLSLQAHSALQEPASPQLSVVRKPGRVQRKA
jgi:hypothetical protein